ncbi:DDE_3 domain-containing protein [Trichonephila clavipes]|nr:DDE_3 domain-containing protein [Trichonephila clavipes]
MLGSRTDLHIFDAGSVNGTRYCNEILLPYVRLFRGAMSLQFLFMDDNAPCHRTTALRDFEDQRPASLASSYIQLVSGERVPRGVKGFQGDPRQGPRNNFKVAGANERGKNSLVNVALYHIHHIWHYRIRLRESGQPIGRLRKTCKNAFPRTIPVSFGRLDTPIATESSL